MPRARNVSATRKRRKKVLKKAKGYFGNKSRLYRYAKDAVDRGEVYAYAHRRKKSLRKPRVISGTNLVFIVTQKMQLIAEKCMLMHTAAKEKQNFVSCGLFA